MANVHERVWERTPERESQRRSARPRDEWRPLGTFGLLGAMLVVYVLELMTIGDEARFNALWTIEPGWWLRPWTPITSTFAHHPSLITHLLLNGLILYFFGPILERILGMKRYLALFVVTGALTGILQVELNQVFFGDTNAALGASGAIMMVFGALAVLMPNQKILLFFIIPVPFWAAAVGYALLDVLGALNPNDGIGNFAHLAGMAVGAVVGFRLRGEMRTRGLAFAPADGR